MTKVPESDEKCQWRTDPQRFLLSSSQVARLFEAAAGSSPGTHLGHNLHLGPVFDLSFEAVVKEHIFFPRNAFHW